MKNFFLKIIKYFKKKNIPDKNIIERNRMFESIKYWTPELIDWIGTTQDSIKLAVTSCLLNCDKWPEWLPSKPDWFDDFEKQREDSTYSEKLFFLIEVINMLRDKSQSISPGLHQKIWLTNYYRTYSTKDGNHSKS